MTATKLAEADIAYRPAAYALGRGRTHSVRGRGTTTQTGGRPSDPYNVWMPSSDGLVPKHDRPSVEPEAPLPLLRPPSTEDLAGDLDAVLDAGPASETQLAEDESPDLMALESEVEATQSARARPRVWTLALAFSFLLSFYVVEIVVLAVIAVLKVRSTGQEPTSEAIQKAYLELALSSTGVGVTLAASSVFLMGFAVTCAAVGPTPIRSRLRLGAPSWKLSSPLLGYLLAAVLLLSFAQADQTVLILAFGEIPTHLVAIGGIFEEAQGIDFAILLFITAFLAPIGEEAFFRGYMQPRLVDRWGPIVGILLTSLLFGLIHFESFHMAYAFFVGLVLGVLAHRAQSLWPAVCGHVALNTLASMPGSTTSLLPSVAASLVLSLGLFLVTLWVFLRVTKDSGDASIDLDEGATTPPRISL